MKELSQKRIQKKKGMKELRQKRIQKKGRNERIKVEKKTIKEGMKE